MRALATRRYTAAVVVFYVALFLLSSSGRLASADAGAELQAAMRLVTSGGPGAERAPAGGAAGWAPAANGRYYEPHDIGPVLLLAPAAWLGHALSGRTAAEDFDSPPLVSRVAGSLTYAVMAALACALLYGAFARDVDLRQAFLLSLLLPATTFFWPYAKTAWDVLGGASAICAVLYASRRLLDPEGSLGDAAALGGAIVVACSFRYSLLPFLAVSLAVLAWLDRRRRWQPWALLAAIVAVGLLPTFAYNAVRIGSPFRPANASPAYLQTNNALTGAWWHGVWGLVAAPNRGLLFFAPTTALLLGLPAVWARLRPAQRATLAAFGSGSLLYFTFIAKLRNWGGGFGWGPRYLLPILPVVVYAAGVVVSEGWQRQRRMLAAVVLGATLLQLPAVLTNWSLAIVVFPRALDQDAALPYQHLAAWRTLLLALEGRGLPVPPELAADLQRTAGARFPDLWVARLAERSPAGLWAAAAAAILLAVILAAALRVLLAA